MSSTLFTSQRPSRRRRRSFYLGDSKGYVRGGIPCSIPHAQVVALRHFRNGERAGCRVCFWFEHHYQIGGRYIFMSDVGLGNYEGSRV